MKRAKSDTSAVPLIFRIAGFRSGMKKTHMKTFTKLKIKFKTFTVERTKRHMADASQANHIAGLWMNTGRQQYSR